MRAIADALFATEGTRARTAKVASLAEALAGVAERAPDRLPFAARFLTGTLLATDDDRTLGAGGALVFEASCAVSGATPSELGELTGKHGDLGTAVYEAMTARGESGPGLTLAHAEECALTLAESNVRADKLRALTTALEACSPLEARYLVRAVLGEMRVGAKEGIALEAIAKAFGRPIAAVRAAAGLVADVGELARLAHRDELATARVVVGRPIDFMLATPIETARGVDLSLPHSIEDKVDGIRAQAHIGASGARLFARGKGAVTTAFPEIVSALEDASRRGMLEDAILDGEIVVMGKDGRARPFSAIQPRLKKTIPDEALIREYPVSYLVYDILYEGVETLMPLPFLERRARLERWAENAPPPIALHDSRPLVIAADDTKDAVLEREFAAARARGHEGLVLKRLDAPYAAGVRGFAWLKVKKALATLDVVVVAAERGHGKRAGVLSDYTFAIRAGSELATIGKAYSGLTDAEIAAMTTRLTALATAPEKRGWMPVRPEIVLEVGFDGLQRSQRHTSGFALRFPRITRIRDDKTPSEIDTIDTVQALWDTQLASGHREEQRTGVKKKGRKSGYRPDTRKKSKQLRLFDD
ncbi:MAG: ATP-dependent DNA ligase [Labilithrix sp.]|nr:ATP-dependent DNA ligase [Labilithrix sp.]MCW5816197.1 ATP-dependent DNA ligase [Labilithrix sp.]